LFELKLTKEVIYFP